MNNYPCESPLSLPRPNGRGNADRISVNCGKCNACRLRRIEDYKTRASQEYKYSENAFFTTLTYSDENLSYDFNTGEPILKKRDYQLFLKKLRKSIIKDEVLYHSHKNKLLKSLKMRFILCGEYGPEHNRPHYHAILFNIPNLSISRNDHQAYVSNLIQSCWDKGFAQTEFLESGAISYMASYVFQSATWTKHYQRPFIVSSQGLGKQYITHMKDYHQDDISRTSVEMGKGFKARMPRYYRDKIYSAQTVEHQAELKNAYAVAALEKGIEFHGTETQMLAATKELAERAVNKLVKKKKSTFKPENNE